LLKERIEQVGALVGAGDDEVREVAM